MTNNFLFAGFKDAKEFFMENVMSPEEEEKVAEIEVEVRANVVDEQTEEDSLAASINDVEENNTAAEQLFSTITNLELARDTIKTYGMSKGLMAYLNHDNQLNDLFKQINVSTSVPGIESINATGTYDKQAEMIVQAIEMSIQQIKQTLATFIKRIIVFLKELAGKLINFFTDCTKKVETNLNSIKSDMKTDEPVSEWPALIYKEEDLATIRTNCEELLKHVNNLDFTIAQDAPDAQLDNIVATLSNLKKEARNQYSRINVVKYSEEVLKILKLNVPKVINDTISRINRDALAKANENNSKAIANRTKEASNNLSKVSKIIVDCGKACVALQTKYMAAQKQTDNK